MKQTYVYFKAYVSNLIRKWVFWLFIALDLVGAIIQIVFPSIQIPQFIYIAIALLGLLWASFQTYRDLFVQIPSEDVPVEPQLSISLVEGNEYFYGFRDISRRLTREKVQLITEGEAEDLQDITTLPESQVVFHVRIKNIGYVPVHILTVFARIDFQVPYSFMIPDPMTVEGDPMEFPIRLNPNENLLHDMVGLIFQPSFLTDAQVAVRTRRLIKENAFTELVLATEVSDSRGNTKSFSTKYPVSLRPLCDLYIEHWQSIGQTELLRLSGQEFKYPETIDTDKADSAENIVSNGS